MDILHALQGCRVERALKISDRAYIMDQGVIVHSADARSLLADKDIQPVLLGVTALGVMSINSKF